MHCPDLTDSSPPVIAVVGGGASGALVAAHLLGEAAAGQRVVRVALIDRGGRRGSGPACEHLAEAKRRAGPASRLSLVRSEVVAIRYTGRPHPLRLHLGADGRIDADLVVLAIGADGAPGTLLASLLEAGLARPGPLPPGIDAAADGAVLDAAGRASGRLFTLSPPGPPYPPYPAGRPPAGRDDEAAAGPAGQAAALARRLVTARTDQARTGSTG